MKAQMFPHGILTNPRFSPYLAQQRVHGKANTPPSLLKILFPFTVIKGV